MRIRLIALAMPLLASTLLSSSLLAQRTRRVVFEDERGAQPMLQTVTVDLAEAVRERYSATVEPLVFGRFSIALSGGYTTSNDYGNPYGYPYPVADCPVNRTCTVPSSVWPPNQPSFREWNFAAHGRWYPEALARANARQSIGAYVGEFLSYRERRSSQVVYYPCAYCEVPPQDSSVTYPPTPYPGGGTTTSSTVSAWEPGAEAGFRIVAARHLVIDVGGSFRLVRLDDFQSPVRRGDVDSRLTIGVGYGW